MQTPKVHIGFVHDQVTTSGQAYVVKNVYIVYRSFIAKSRNIRQSLVSLARDKVDL